MDAPDDIIMFEKLITCVPSLSQPPFNRCFSVLTWGAFVYVYRVKAVIPMIICDVENYDAASFDDMLKFMLEKVDTAKSIDPDKRLQNTLQAVVGLCKGKGKTLPTSLAE